MNSAGVPYTLPPAPDADPSPLINYPDWIDCAVDDACSRQCVANYIDKFRYFSVSPCTHVHISRMPHSNGMF